MQYLKSTIPAFLTAAILFVAANAQTPNFNRERTYDVQHYILRVSFDRAKKRVIGDTTVQLKPLHAGMREVELDAAGLVFERISVDSSEDPLKYRTRGAKVIVSLDRAYSADETISLHFKYTATPKKGVYFVPEKIVDKKRRSSPQIWTQGEPDEAHHWFPSFDFPSDKATTEQIITVNEGETVIGNGKLISESDNGDGTITFHYKMDVPHSTYLVSFVVGEYTKISDDYKGLPLDYYVYPGYEDLVNTGYGRTKDMMAIFEELTGMAYPYNKYDQTIVSDFQFGGMENITATTMADTEILLSRSLLFRGLVDDLVSHELAHAWFGNLVTCNNWAELWLNEGFATFMEAAVREKQYGREDYMRKVLEDAEEFLTFDEINKKQHGLFNRDAANLNALFDKPAITYDKGGAVIHTLREEIGEDAFWSGVRSYLQKHKFANAETADLKKSFEKSSGKDLGWFFDQWVYGTGAPNLIVKYAYDPEKRQLSLDITQTQNGKLTPKTFRLPMELDIRGNGTATIKKIDITKRSERFTLELDLAPETLTFDPKSKIPIKTVKVERAKK